MDSKINDFDDLEAWKKGHQLVLEIYKITKEFPKEEKFGIISQLQRASSSITANVAEGFSRYHFNDKSRFYYQARGSVSEVKNFLLLAKDLDYLDSKTLESLIEITNTTQRLINGLIRSIGNQK
ncbi:MAG: four helix bundle protein [Candidatus Terrybacteria bacterium]|nr:four helix bundle protein [Candidatus Terrybacteria bacterium]